MTLKEANIKLKQLENDLNYWIEKKNLEIEKLMPKSPAFGERVEGGKRVDKYAHLDITIDEIDPIIENLNKEIRILRHYIEEELKIIGEYEPLERKIIYLRNEERLQWRYIAERVNYSERQCQRIYDKYYQRQRQRKPKI